MKLENVNLNLLKVLDVILQERSVSKAAEKLHQSQPATTHALNKLRKLFNDKLFIKTPGGMEPTAFAKSLQAELRSIIAQINDLVSKEREFDPHTSRRTFRLGTMEFTEFLIVPSLMRWLSDHESLLQLDVKTVTMSNVLDSLNDGEVEVAVSHVSDLPSHISSQKVFAIEPTCLIHKDHPLATSEMSIEEYISYPHIGVLHWMRIYRGFSDYLARNSYKRHVKLVLPNPVAIGDILPGTDLIATVPTLLAKFFMQRHKELVTKPFPFEVAKPEVKMLWHARHDNDVGHQWLRERIFEILQKHF